MISAADAETSILRNVSRKYETALTINPPFPTCIYYDYYVYKFIIITISLLFITKARVSFPRVDWLDFHVHYSIIRSNDANASLTINPPFRTCIYYEYYVYKFIIITISLHMWAHVGHVS